MPSIDYKNIDHDLEIEDGDFVKEDCQQDHIENILLVNKGSYRQFPLVGVNLIAYVNGPVISKTQIALNKSIRLQLEADSYRVTKVNTIDFEQIQIHAEK